MSTPPPDPRDLRLARRLDAGEAPDGTDPLHDALDMLRPDSATTESGSADRLWARIEPAVRTEEAAAVERPGRAEDRSPLRLVRSRAVRWAAAGVVLIGVGVATWLVQRGPDVVAVATAEIVTWEAPDGSTVTLRPYSRLVRLGNEDRSYRLEGEAFFAVVSDPDRPFTVGAGPAEVRVLGTRFGVSTWGARTDVFVEEGRVRVSADDEAVVLAAGEAASANAAGVSPLLDAAAESFLDWQRGELVFDRVPLRRVAAEIGQHFGVTLSVPPAVADESVSGVIPLASEAQVLDDLGRILGGRFEPVEGGYRLVLP